MIDPQQSAKAQRSPAASSRFWQTQLHLAEREHKDFWSEAKNIVQRYKSEKQAMKGRASARKYSVLYANTETMRAAVYARSAKPDVRQRFANDDQIARTGAEVLERALTYCLDDPRHDTAVRAGVMDALLAGRGVVRVEYEPETGMVEDMDPITGQPMMREAIIDQKVMVKFVRHANFLHSPAECWEDVWWIAFRHRMTLDDLRENGFENADAIPRNWTPDGEKESKEEDDLARAEVWEIWHKPRKERVWVVKGHPTVLRTDGDPYGLQDFWPMPCDLAFIRSSDTHIPVPEFRQYAELADDLDETTNRISRLTRELKRRGVYDSTVKELKRLARAGDNEFIPVENYAQFVTKGGLEQAFQTENIESIAAVLLQLYKAQEQLEAKIDKITGVADIMRGEGQASETATAQQIKAQYGGLRLKDRQKAVQHWIRGLVRLHAELVAEHYEPHVLSAMTGMEVPPEVIQMLRDDKLRSYAVDIETDSTVFEDAEAEKQARVEVTEAMTGLLERGLMVMQAAPEMGELIFESMGLLLKTMKGGRQLEDVLDRARQMMQQRMSQPQQEQPNPQLEVEQAKAENEMAKMQVENEMHQQNMAMDQEAKVLDLNLAREKHNMSLEAMQAKALMAKEQAKNAPAARK